MAWTQISNSVPQYSRDASGTSASGYYLKYYADGTTTPISMATDSTGSTLLAKARLNSLGYPVNGSDDVFIPYLEETAKAALFPTADDADSNNFSNAVWVVDALARLVTTESLSEDINEGFESVKRFDDLAGAANNANLVDGDTLNIKERVTGNGGGFIGDVVLASTVTPNGFNIIQCTGVPTLAIVIRDGDILYASQFGMSPNASAAENTGALNAVIEHALTNDDVTNWVVMPAGVMDIVNPININYGSNSSGLKLTGAGKPTAVSAALQDGTVLRCTVADQSISVLEGWHHTFEDFGIDGNDIATKLFCQRHYCVWQRIYSKNHTEFDGQFIGLGNWIQNNRFASKTGLSPTACVNITYNGTTFRDNFVGGNLVTDCLLLNDEQTDPSGTVRAFLIEGNTFESGNECILRVQGTIGAGVIGTNYFEDINNGVAGLWIDGTNATTKINGMRIDQQSFGLNPTTIYIDKIDEDSVIQIMYGADDANARKVKLDLEGFTAGSIDFEKFPNLDIYIGAMNRADGGILINDTYQVAGIKSRRHSIDGIGAHGWIVCELFGLAQSNNTGGDDDMLVYSLANNDSYLVEARCRWLGAGVDAAYIHKSGLVINDAGAESVQAETTIQNMQKTATTITLDHTVKVGLAQGAITTNGIASNQYLTDVRIESFEA